MQCRFDEAVIWDIHRLLKETAINSIVPCEIVLNMGLDTQGSAKSCQVLLAGNVILYETPTNPIADEFIEQLD